MAFFLVVERGRDEAVKLHNKIGRYHHESRPERHFDVRHELRRQFRVDERSLKAAGAERLPSRFLTEPRQASVGDERVRRGGKQQVEQDAFEAKSHRRPYGPGNQAAEQHFPKHL